MEDRRPAHGRRLRERRRVRGRGGARLRDDEVEWKAVSFNQSFRPGPKDFDFDINQISYSDARAKSVAFSDSYYDVNQALVAIKGTEIAGATSVADLKDAKLGA
ncbi:MAG: transporter substrate-binding domain-containing protein [Gaiellaceae bacterium]